MMINVLKLHKALEVAGIPIYGVDSNGGIDFKPEATQAQRDQAAAILAAHDPTDTDKLAQDDAKARWTASAIAGKTPEQIYAHLQARIDGWTSIAQIRADLREWLPLIVAGLAWTAMQDAQVKTKTS